MPRTQFLQTNFSAGALSPKLRGRTDIDRYRNGAKQMTNCYPVIQGGAKRRPGTRFVAEVKDSSKKVRLIPFVTNVASAYVVEAGNLYMRFYKSGARVEVTGTPVEVTTPFTEAQLPTIDYCQDADEMYLAQQANPIQRLVRYSDTVWRYGNAPFSATPFDEIGARFNAALTLSAMTGTGITITAGAAAFLASDVGRAVIYGAGAALITAYTSTTQVTADVRSTFTTTALPANQWVLDISPQTTCTPSATGPVGTTIGLTLGAAGFRSADVGKWVRINGGMVLLTVYASATSMSGIVVVELTGTSAAPALAWTLEANVWNTYDGYPRTVSFYEQRLVAAGSPAFPQTVWGSRTGEFLDFTLLEDDSGGYAFKIASDETNQIAYLVAAKHLLALTNGGEFSVRNVEGKPITPTAVRIEPETNYGSADVRPAAVGRDTLFVQRSGKKLRAARYEYEPDGYQVPDISALAEHLVSKGLVEMAWQSEPDSLLWCVTSDGKLLSCTLDRDVDVIGWADHDVGGAVESICVIPTADGEQLWLAVKRTINGAVKRYVERMDMVTSSALASDRYLLQTDCAAVLTSGSATDTWTGLSHLEQATVAIIAGGSVQPSKVVSGGQVTSQATATDAQIGLPFTTTVELLTPEFGTGEGTIQGTAMSTSEVVLRLLETTGAKINGSVVPTRSLGVSVLDDPPPLFTGDVYLGHLGWDKGQSDVVITQELPMPFHLLAVVRTLTSNAG